MTFSLVARCAETGMFGVASQASLFGRGLAASRAVDVELGGPFRVPSLEDLQLVGPFGQGNPTPLFQLDALLLSAKAVGEGGLHGKLELRVGQDRVRAFAPAMYARCEGRDNVRLVGEFQPDHWIGDGAVELLVKDVLD